MKKDNKMFVLCKTCGKEKLIYKKSYNEFKNYFCNNECRHVFLKLPLDIQYGPIKAKEIKSKISKSTSGENNPNFGNKWTEEQKLKQSVTIKELFVDNDEYRYKSGSANRGKKFTPERCKNISDGHKGLKGASPSEARKVQIGKESKLRHRDPEFKAKSRKTREDNGDWIKLEDKTDWEIYTKYANWIKSMFDIVNIGKNLLLEFGVFNSRTNTKGVVRDHIYSRRSGFIDKVYPEILRHPANCQILTHADNIRKKSNRYIDRNDHTILELFEKIRNYKEVWFEQELVLNLIKLYEEGKRWERNTNVIY